MTIFNVLSLIGGLALFLFGMSVMGQALEKAAGSKLKTVLSKLTGSPLRGLLLGAAVTAVIQSSSATTVMVVGFVNSGIMQLRQAIGVIMGANIGTTITAWILSLTGIDSSSVAVQLLKPTSFTPMLALIGIIMYMAAKHDKQKNIGMVLLGFSVLMYGMTAMSSAVKPLSEVPAFTQIFVAFSNPLLGILAGLALTAIIQSSSASVGILQALAATGSVTFGSAIPIIMGQNIGTCVTALISSVGTTKNARRAALVHLYFNIIGTLVCTAVFYALNAILDFSFLSGKIDQLGIAIVHTAFNVACTALLLPFSKQLEKLATKSVRETSGDNPIMLLDKRLLSAPSIAVERCRKLTCEMAALVRENLLLAITLLAEFSEDTLSEVIDGESKADLYEDQLGTYLVLLSAKPMSGEDSRTVSKLLHSITDFERISDHALNIAQSAKELAEKNISFSPQAQDELRTVTDAVIEIISIASESFENNDIDLAKRVEPLEEVVDGLTVCLKDAHVRRLQTGECTINVGFVFNDVLTDFERISDHCSNIAVCQIELARSSFDAHAYINNVKTGGDPQFLEAYAEYQEKYSLPS